MSEDTPTQSDGGGDGSGDERSYPSQSNGSDEAIPKVRNRQLYATAVLIGYSFLLYLTIALYYIDTDKEEWNRGFLFGSLVLFYTILSLRSVNEQKLGAIFFFGQPLFPVTYGLKFVPLGLFRLSVDTRLVIQDELPTNPELIWRGDENITPDLVEKGFRPPIRITFGFINIRHFDISGRDNGRNGVFINHLTYGISQ